MNCPYCGTSSSDGAYACAYCGTKLLSRPSSRTFWVKALLTLAIPLAIYLVATRLLPRL